MKRRIRSSPGCSRRAAPRGALVGLAIGLGVLVAACSSDLFHDTKWQSRCDAEPDAAICPQGTGGAGGTSSTSATSSASNAASSSAAAGTTSSSSASSMGGAGGGTSTTTGTSTVAASSSTG